MPHLFVDDRPPAVVPRRAGRPRRRHRRRAAGPKATRRPAKRTRPGRAHERLRRHRHRRRPGRRALRRAARRRRAEGGDRRARARRRRVRLLGLHPVEDAAAARRGARRHAREAPGRARGGERRARRREPAFAWRDFMVSDYDDSGQAGVARGQGHRRCSAATGAHRRARTRRGRRRRAHAPTHIVDRHRLRPGRSRRSPACASSTASGPTARPPGSRRCPRRLLVLGGGPVGVEMAPGGSPLRRVGGARRGRGPRCSRASRAQLGEALGEALAAEGIELASASTRRPRGATDGDYVLEFAERRRAPRRPAAGRHRPPAAGGRHRPRHGRASSPASAGSRSTRA